MVQNLLKLGGGGAALLALFWCTHKLVLEGIQEPGLVEQFPGVLRTRRQRAESQSDRLSHAAHRTTKLAANSALTTGVKGLRLQFNPYCQ